jgi:hypothetical protein
MNKLQRKAIERLAQIAQEGQQKILDLAISKEDDKKIATEIKSMSTTGTEGNQIYCKFKEVEEWAKAILNTD